MIPGSVCEGDSGRSCVIVRGPNEEGTVASMGRRHPLGAPAQQGGAEVQTPSLFLTWDVRLLPLTSVLLVPRPLDCAQDVGPRLPVLRPPDWTDFIAGFPGPPAFHGNGGTSRPL